MLRGKSDAKHEVKPLVKPFPIKGLISCVKQLLG